MNLKSLILDLGRNKIKCEGMGYLANALSSTTGLTSLSLFLYDNNIAKTGARYLKEILQSLQNLKKIKLDLNDNKNMGKDICVALGQGMAALKYVEDMDLCL